MINFFNKLLLSWAQPYSLAFVLLFTIVIVETLSGRSSKLWHYWMWSIPMILMQIVSLIFLMKLKIAFLHYQAGDLFDPDAGVEAVIRYLVAGFSQSALLGAILVTKFFIRGKFEVNLKNNRQEI